MNHFANNLKFVRRHYGLSQQRLAEATSIPKHNIGAYEEGRSEPNIDKLITLASTLKISIDELCKSELTQKS